MNDWRAEFRQHGVAVGDVNRRCVGMDSLLSEPPRGTTASGDSAPAASQILLAARPCSLNGRAYDVDDFPLVDYCGSHGSVVTALQGVHAVLVGRVELRHPLGHGGVRARVRAAA
jgi:hypothetical protein